MKFRLRSWRACHALSLLLLAVFAANGAQTKLIHLRNLPIPPKFAKALEAPRKSGPEAAASGLFLVQFTGSLDSAARAQLAAEGVDLLHYIPQDTFLARFHGARLDLVRALPFVQWVGEYRSDHKTHRALSAQSASPNPNEILSVAVLLAPRATGAEVAESRRAFSEVRQQSTLRAGTVLRGKLNRARLDALARSDSVIWIEPSRPMKLFDEVSSKIVAGDGGPNTLLTASLGYDGSGVSVAVADSGLDNGDPDFMHPDLLGRTPAFFYYGNLTDGADEHGHGTHVAGIIAGNGAVGEVDDNGALYGLGVAPGASIIGQRIFDAEGGYEAPPSFEKLTRDATRAGAVIGSNSWGDDTQGAYDLSAMEFDELVRDADALAFGDQQYVLEFSAGNAGPGGQTVGSPAVGKNVIATGASESDRADFFSYEDGPEAMADFSSRGPCEDGRIKPDVVAPGTWIASLQSGSASDVNAWLPISANYQYEGGTSQAGPHASGAAAVFVQFYRDTHTNATPSPALVKAALIHTAIDMEDDFGTDPVPNADEGWGRIDLTEFVDLPDSFSFVDQTSLLATGQTFERRVNIANASEPFKATLVYTDVPGFPGAIGALVNDLDLEVVGPDGKLYLGNRMENGESIPNAAQPDAVNNVEAVRLNAPLAGQYTVRVRARNVVEDARLDSGAIDQDFALVISGQVSAPGTGAIGVNQQHYGIPGTIKISSSDSDLAGQPSLAVQVRSTTESAGETVLLAASDTSGSFTGAIATAAGPPAADGKLQIAHNDLIEVHYFDVSTGIDRVANARADLVAPVITNVAWHTEFGQTLVTWHTDEPANSTVRYGTNSSVPLLAADPTLTTEHAVALPGLIVSNTYFFVVISSDEAGNTATNNNGGTLFNFIAPSVPPILLVDAFVSNGFDNDIPLGVYTGTLDQAGLAYAVWDPDQVGRSPLFNDLRPFRAVIWRFNDGVLSGETLSGAEQSAIRNYVNAGGSFFMASMEQLTRLGKGFFRRDVLHITDFSEDAGVPDADGLDGDAITGGLSLPLEYSQYDNFFHQIIGVPDDISDTMILGKDAAPIFYDSFGEIAGLKFPKTGVDSPGRVVFLGFPLDAVSSTDPAPNNRLTLVRNIFSFLIPGVNGRGTVALDSTAYNIPSVATIEVADSDLIGQGSLSVSCFSTTQTGGMAVTLAETSRPGLFRGTASLIAATNNPTPGKLRVASGDTFWVDYFDVSSNAVVRATALVDTAKPTLSNVASFPDYEEAVITWTTSEPANSLVQFGESAFLNRTASDPALTTSHGIAVQGLLPDKTYYFQVTSVDAAGNTVVNDNGGNLYSFHTLAALLPPWFDNLNAGATNWSVINADGSQSEWTLGVPRNQLGTNNAHSPTNAWGSNLTGDAIDYTETFLISPPIYLTNGNVATLRFWHNYDFTQLSDNDILEQGQLLIITNATTEPVVLKQYEFDDFTDGWEEEQISLTPFVGHVVYLVWYYALGSFETAARPGWLVDDVSVTVTNVPPGTIVITNNLWQTTYILSGQMYRKSKGLGSVITNAPPGRYIVEFSDVPFYQTPSPQTNDLVSGGISQFSGFYTFADANTNSISDSWEQHYFASVSSNRTRLTDTDGDGMTDYAEFIAGTDPLNPPAPFRLTVQPLSNAFFRIEWASAAGLQHRLHSSTNATSWSAYTDWFQSTGTVARFDVPIAASGPKRLFRVETAASMSPTSPAPYLRLTIETLNGGSTRLSWNSTVGRGYQLEANTNNLTWFPVSPWIRATSGTTVYTLPPPPAGPNCMFRVQVQP